MQEKEIYFHVGLGKVASTYLQKSLFPNLKGINYIPSSKYRKSKEIIKKGGLGKYLVSREFDIQLEEEIKWFTETFPQTRIIIFFRRHDSWIASQYRRFVKNGWHFCFEDFIDPVNNKGLWKKDQLLYFPKLEILERYCANKPLVLFYDELSENPERLFDKICNFTHTTIDVNDVSLARVHASFSDKSLIILRAFCRRFIRFVPKPKQNIFLHWLTYRPWWGFFHLILYSSSLLPDSLVGNQPLIDPEMLLKIKHDFNDDWDKISLYAKENNVV